MRINQEDRPGVSDLPPLEVERKVEKLAKQTLEEVITAIPPIENSTYILSQHTVANEKDVVLDLWSKSLYTGGEQLGSF